MTVFKGEKELISMEMSIDEVMNTIYKDFLMEPLQQCSDMPSFEDKWEPPFPARTFEFTQCTIPDLDGYSSMMMPGKFKIVVEGMRGTEKVSSLEVEVENSK